MASATSDADVPAPYDHAAYLNYCLNLAKQAPALPTNFRVGAVIVHGPSNEILATGYTMELPGNTHAEQVCLSKLAAAFGCSKEDAKPDWTAVPIFRESGVVLYTTVEPCVKRLSGNQSCVERIVETTIAGGGIETVYVGVKEPETFVGKNEGQARLEKVGIRVVLVEGMEENILDVATAGHQADHKASTGKKPTEAKG